FASVASTMRPLSIRLYHNVHVICYDEGHPNIRLVPGVSKVIPGGSLAGQEKRSSRSSNVFLTWESFLLALDFTLERT
ncbi:10947_t:CDS:2, partial [Acaulospora colombiana]